MLGYKTKTVLGMRDKAVIRAGRPPSCEQLELGVLVLRLS